MGGIEINDIKNRGRLTLEESLNFCKLLQKKAYPYAFIYVRDINGNKFEHYNDLQVVLDFNSFTTGPYH